jgi:hypothetical protein
VAVSAAEIDVVVLFLISLVPDSISLGNRSSSPKLGLSCETSCGSGRLAIACSLLFLRNKKSTGMMLMSMIASRCLVLVEDIALTVLTGCALCCV